MLGMRSVVNTHLTRERLDVMLAVLLPLILMAESGYANAWIFAAGRLGLDLTSVIALFRGFFLEALIFACFKLVKVFCSKGGKMWLAAPVPGSVGVVGMIVSAGCNLGWMAQSPEMQAAMHAVSLYLPLWMGNTFRIGLGLLFPIAVGVFALFDVRHLVEEALNSSHLDDQALLVNRAEMHRTAYLKAQQKQIKAASASYNDICAADANNMVHSVRQGDLSFGSRDITRVQPVTPSVTRIQGPVLAPPQIGMGNSAGRPGPMGSASAWGQPPIQGQFGPAAPMPTGNTQNIQMPSPPPQMPQQNGGMLRNLFGN